MALFAILAILMVIGSYLFIALLAAACVYLPYLLLTQSDSMQAILLFLFGILIAAAMLWSLIPRRDKFTAPGLLLERSSYPQLFAEIDGIAAALNEPVPPEVYLVGDVNAFVADRGGILGIGSRRIMGLGLPLLATMTVSQFRAVLAHEFAHYYGGDTSLGPWVYKTKSSIVRVFENIGSVGKLARIAILGVMYLIVAHLLKWYFIGFLSVINLVSRRQEFRADELACMVAGRKNLIDGLQTIHRTSAAWPSYWEHEVAPILGEGNLVAVGDGLTRFMSVPQISEAIDKTLEKRLREEKTQPYDTHPPLRDRIDAAMAFPADAASQDSRPAAILLGDLPSAEMKFVEHTFTDLKAGSLQYVPWNQVALRVTIPSWQKFVDEYADALKNVTAESIPDHMPGLREIGSRIRDPKGMLLSPEQRTGRAASLFAAALSLAMIRNGWELNVQPGVFKMTKAGRELNPFQAVDQMRTNKLSREAWIAQCQELGVSKLALLPGGPSEPHSSLSPQAELFS